MEAKNNEYELLVSQPENPLWKIILSGLFYAFGVYGIINILLMQAYSDLSQEERIIFNKNVILLMIGLFMGVYFSVRLTILIDLKTNKLVSKYFLGFFSVKTTTKIPKLEYVGVFKNSEEVFMINLWYKENKHFNMCYTEEKEPAMKFAQMVSEKLNIDILDATEKGNSKWIDKPLA